MPVTSQAVDSEDVTQTVNVPRSALKMLRKEIMGIIKALKKRISAIVSTPLAKIIP
jgi:hypothetical protein